jgi:hypothetical protein
LCLQRTVHSYACVLTQNIHLQIEGVGAKKRDDYGTALLFKIRDYLSRHPDLRDISRQEATRKMTNVATVSRPLQPQKKSSLYFADEGLHTTVLFLSLFFVHNKQLLIFYFSFQMMILTTMESCQRENQRLELPIPSQPINC